ncbi:MAG: hypothetical protein IT436_05215 [Phycisphaerales bacterium]|nr:hypothetical protein [Phycisphaerales bacterium]
MSDFELLSSLFGDGAKTRNMVAAMGGTRTAVYLAMLYLRSLRGPTFTASVSELQLLTRYGNKSVRRALTGLVALGFIRRGPTNGEARSYQVVGRGSGQMDRTPTREFAGVL